MQWSGNSKVTWKCSLKTCSPSCVAVIYGHRFKCISMVSSRLFDLFCISYNWKVAFVFVLEGNKFLIWLLLVTHLSFENVGVILSKFWVPDCQMVCWKAKTPQMFPDTFMCLPSITLWADENEHEASSTFLSLFLSFPKNCLIVKQCLWIHALCVRLSVYDSVALLPTSPKVWTCWQLIWQKNTDLKVKFL